MIEQLRPRFQEQRQAARQQVSSTLSEQHSEAEA